MICTSHASSRLLACCSGHPQSQHLEFGSSGRPVPQQCQLAVSLRHTRPLVGGIRKCRNVVEARVERVWKVFSSDAALRELPTRIQRWWRSSLPRRNRWSARPSAGPSWGHCLRARDPCLCICLSQCRFIPLAKYSERFDISQPSHTHVWGLTKRWDGTDTALILIENAQCLSVVADEVCDAGVKTLVSFGILIF